MISVSLDGHITCPVCRQLCQMADIIDNMFLPAVTQSAAVDGTSDLRVCTGCEENIPAAFFCVDCTEWLCDQCTQAHRRVKVTKDHTVEPKENGVGGPQGRDAFITARSQLLPCPAHPSEHLKLYCDTCARLTCRDCQLVEHKDHKYQFLPEAAAGYRDFLVALLSKIREKQTYIENAKSLIDHRNREIVTKEMTVVQEVKTFAMGLITEVNRKGRQLIGELQAICNAKRRQLEQKDREIQSLAGSLEHGLRFAEFLLERGDDTGLLYSRRTLAKQLRLVLQTRCEVPNPNHVVDLRFASNSALAASISKLGYIVVDGVPFHNPRASAAAAGSATSATPPGSGGVSSSSLGSRQAATAAVANSPLSGPAGRTPSSVVGSLSNDQKIQLLLHMRKQMERQRMQSQQQNGAGGHTKHHHPHGQQPPPPQAPQHHGPTTSFPQQLQQHRRLLTDPLQQSTAGVPFGSRRLTHLPNAEPPPEYHHLPNQSANISSSNQQRIHAAGTYFPPGTSSVVDYSSASVQYYPATASSSSHASNKINLAQLQEGRLRRQYSEQEQVTTSLQPIIIQPNSNYQDSSPVGLMPSSGDH